MGDFTKVKETVRSHAANATAVTKLRSSTVATTNKVKETVRSGTAIASEYLSDPKSRDSISKFAINASINVAKTIPGGVGTVVDIVSQSIPDKKNQNHDDDKYMKRIVALEDEVKELRSKKELKPSATSKL